VVDHLASLRADRASSTLSRWRTTNSVRGIWSQRPAPGRFGARGAGRSSRSPPGGDRRPPIARRLIAKPPIETGTLARPLPARRAPMSSRSSERCSAPRRAGRRGATREP
jgi:hypothetical protein